MIILITLSNALFLIIGIYIGSKIKNPVEFNTVKTLKDKIIRPKYKVFPKYEPKTLEEQQLEDIKKKHGSEREYKS